MMKNIPSQYTVKDLVGEIDGQFKNKYDYLYMPYDQNVKLYIRNIQKNGNLGYAFINLLTPLLVKEFYQQFNYRKWKMHNPYDKVIH